MCVWQINKGDAEGCTPLLAACWHRHLSVVQHLLKLGADLEIADKNGVTCLMLACWRGHKEIVSYLIDHGAQVNRQDSTGMISACLCLVVTVEAGLGVMKPRKRHAW